jgi:putative ABC transport system permease protein
VRRDLRQYTLILALLTVAVAASVALTSVAYNIAPAEGRAEFGDADHALFWEQDDPQQLSDWLAVGGEVFGTIDTIGHRTVAVPGSTRNVELRVQEVGGPFAAPLLDVLDGRAPRGDDEAAVTDGVADLLSVAIGDVVELDGVSRVVVGTVENPSALDDEFVLLAPSALPGSTAVTMLTSADEGDIRRFGAAVGPMRVGSRAGVSEDVLAGILMLLATTVLLVLVALVASASFTVIAQRRLPQLGMLAAIGASERHVRLSMLASGAVAGVVGAVSGALIGVGAWLTLAPAMEETVNHRINTSNVPLWLVALTVVLAIVATTAAAWWPARTMSRIPTVMALSGRTPRPRRPHRSAVSALALVCAGAAGLYLGSDFSERGPNATETLLLVCGTLTVIAGVLLVSPAVINAVGRGAAAFPVGGRLALRDLSRYPARSSAALAAIALALGIPSVIVAATAAADNASPLENLAANQILIRADEANGPFAPDADDVERIEAGIAQLSDVLGEVAVTPIDAVRDPAFPRDPKVDRNVTVSIVRQVDDGWEHLDSVYAASPDLLAALGLDGDAVEGGEVMTSRTGDLFLFGTRTDSDPRRSDGEPLATTGSLPATYTSLPSALITPAAAEARGWEIVPSGRWLIETSEPLTASQIDQARDVATRSGFVIETSEGDSRLRTVRLGAGVLGMMLAIAVLAATVGLIRGESANELRALTAAGATKRTRRGITAVTAGALALMGAALGIASAYIALIAGRVEHLTPLPWFDLCLIGLATPALATAGAWLFAGREPPAISRRPLD